MALYLSWSDDARSMPLFLDQYVSHVSPVIVGRNLLTRTDWFDTTLVVSNYGSDEEIIDLLLQAGANPCMPDYNLRTPISSINFNNDGVADLYDGYRMIPNKNGPTELHQAVAEGALVRVKDLLDDKVHRSRINKQDDQGFTALHYAVLWRHLNKEDLVQRLIIAGADVNVTDMYKCTSLHYAVGTCSESLTKLILGAGGHTGAMNQYQRTPAEIALSRKMPNLHRILMRHTKSL